MGPQSYIGFKQINLQRLLSTYCIKCSTWFPNISSQLGKPLRKILLTVWTCKRTMEHHKWAPASRELISINTLGTMSGTLMRGWKEQDTDSTGEAQRGASFPWHLAPFGSAALTRAKLMQREKHSKNDRVRKREVIFPTQSRVAEAYKMPNTIKVHPDVKVLWWQMQQKCSQTRNAKGNTQESRNRSHSTACTSML